MSEDYVSPGPKRTLKMVAINPEILQAADALAKAAKEIAAMRDTTLLGMCCVEKSCRPTEHSSCSLQEKVATAFNQAASIAESALAAYEKARSLK